MGWLSKNPDNKYKDVECPVCKSTYFRLTKYGVYRCRERGHWFDIDEDAEGRHTTRELSPPVVPPRRSA